MLERNRSSESISQVFAINARGNAYYLSFDRIYGVFAPEEHGN
jgi:hypothetical protein